MPYIGRAPTSTATKLEDADQDTKIQVEESSDEDVIRFDIAGAEDFTMTANTLTALSGSTIATNTIAETTGASGVTVDGLLIKDSTAAFADGAVATPSITNSGDTNTGIYFPAADTVGVVAGGVEQFRFGSNPIPGGSKNLVTNGGMNVAQRGTQTGQYSGYTVDQFWFQEGGSIQARFTTSQDSSGGGGHANSLKLDTTTAESTVATGDLLNIQHRIEAQNLQHLQWGTASAKDVTLSFWMSSPKTGTHCVSLYQVDATRSYISEFTIASADTFEYFSVTIPGDTGGTINDDTGPGLYVSFPLFSGAAYQAAAGSWLASQDYATSNQQNLADNTANNVFLTGVQLEVGSVATDFAHEDYGTTLEKCHRYFERREYEDASDTIGAGLYTVTTVSTIIIHYSTKRVQPTITFEAATNYRMLDQNNATYTASGIAAGAISHTTTTLNLTTAVAALGGAYATVVNATHIDISAEL